jgi:hypothetical protein
MLALWLAFPAWACDRQIPLHVRTVQPPVNAIDVPVDARIMVSLKGWGTIDEVEVVLRKGGSTISVDLETWCYDHEGPYELHCYYRLLPEEELIPGTVYTIEIRSTETFQGDEPLSQNSQFTVGSDRVTPFDGPPELAIVDAVDVAPEDLTECDYDQPRRYMVSAESSNVAPHGLSVLHLTEFFPDGSSPDALVHTVLVSKERTTLSIKQYLDGSMPRSDCFRLQLEDGAGRLSEVVEDCWIVIEDSGDSGSSDSGVPIDSDVPTDSTVPTDSNQGTGVGPLPAPAEEGICGCGAIPGAGSPWVLIAGLLGWTGRRRRVAFAVDQPC